MSYRIGLVVMSALLILAFGCSRDEPTPTSTPVDIMDSGPLFAAGVQLSGAIFTTTEDGSIVNENVRYRRKEDVYLDGGPGPNAPVHAAALPEGDYYFQVTDPSGKDLLSSDHISCRKIHINQYGVIDKVYPGTNYVFEKGSWTAVPCQHANGIDVDYASLGAITVQLYPYDDTPNRGGVYKVWVTRVEDYAGDPNFVPSKPNDDVNGENYQPGNFHGFIPARSKTDNYKVKGKPCVRTIVVEKFHDRNGNGVWDTGEEEISGWPVTVTDPLGVTNVCYTPKTILTELEGTYTFTEGTPDGTKQTVAIVDGIIQSQIPNANPTVTVTVGADCREDHSVIYGNLGLGALEACKVYDKNGNGVADGGEGPVAGFKMKLTGVDVSGAVVGPVVQMTGADGCTTFDDLVPGTYTIEEILPMSIPGLTWVATGPTSVVLTVESVLSGSDLGGTFKVHTFTNVCTGEADFGTKGYWHNKNGLDELTMADIAYVNGLDPYDAPSSYFGAGDEPFDGKFSNGTLVDAANGAWGEMLAPAGSYQAEVSHFLVDANSGGDPREQLAQQLLAFIFNVQHRLDGLNTLIQLSDGSFVLASKLIDDAIAAWAGGSATAQGSMQSLLNALNENDHVPFVPVEPCEVIYYY